MATHLNPSPAQLSDVYGGREHVKDLAGWEGDTTRNANDRDPSIGEDDYKADLGSVNIIERMKKGQSYVEAMSAYYHDVNQGESVREKEFLKNKDWKQVKNTIYASLAPDMETFLQGDKAMKAYIIKKYKEQGKNIVQFLERLEAAAEK